MQFGDFLSLVKVLKMLFGSSVAQTFFLENITRFDKIVDSESLTNVIKGKNPK